VDTAMDLREDIHRLLRQGMDQRGDFEEGKKQLLELAARAGEMRQSKRGTGTVANPQGGSAGAGRTVGPRPGPTPG